MTLGPAQKWEPEGQLFRSRGSSSHRSGCFQSNPEVVGSNPTPAAKREPESVVLKGTARGSGFSFPKGTQTRARRTAVDILPKLEQSQGLKPNINLLEIIVLLE